MQTGTLLAQRYRIEAKLGEGGMGVVYRAHDTLLDRPVAIKALSPHLLGAEGLKRLLREAQSAARLTHPNIVAVYDVIEDDSTRLIVMEYVAGQTLRDRIPLPWPQAVEIAAQVCRALQYAHANGIVHRDIKPENIVITPDGTAKVMDFGLARSEGRSRVTQTGLIVGTVAYMAPEQALSGQTDARSDLYSLGCVMFEMVTGRPPFQTDDPISVISMHINVPPVAPRFYNTEIPPALDSIILRLLVKDPTQRYASAEELARILDTALAPVEAPQDAAAVIEAQAAAPSLLEMMARGRLVDREQELAALKGSLDSMLSGRGQAVLVAGEPGIGKTRLAQELLVFARLRGCLTATGRCYEQEVGIPYLPVAEALRAVVREISDEHLETLVARHAAELVKLVPELSQRIRDLQPSPPLDPDQERLRLFEHVTSFLGATSRARPVVVLLDDLHWADAATLQLLRYVARNIRSDRLLLLGTYRDVELDRTHPLAAVLRELNRERLYTRILVRRLSPEHVAEMIRAILQTPNPVSDEFRDLIYRETEGNPFFVEEVLKHLVEVGALYIEGGRWQRKDIHEIDVPQSVREVIGRRLERLSPDCVEILTVASVIGREFDYEVLNAAIEPDGKPGSTVGAGRLLDLLEEGLESQLITEERTEEGVRYNFVHALVRETLYDSLSLRRKIMFHESIGEALEEVYATSIDAHAADLAYHFSQVGRSQSEKAVRYSVRAGDAASHIYAYEEAIAHYRTALDLLPHQDPSRTEIKEKIGTTLSAQGRWTEAARILEEVVKENADRDDTTAIIRNSLVLAGAYRQIPDPDRALVWAGKAAETARAIDDRKAAGRASARMADALWLKGAYEEAAAHARRAYEMAEAAGDERTAIYARIRELISRHPWEGRVDATASDLAVAVGAADRVGITSPGPRSNLSAVLWDQGADIETTLRIHTEAMEICRRAGNLWGVAFSLHNMSQEEFERGDWARADALCAESIATFERIGASFGAEYPRIDMASRRALRGDLQGAMQELRALLASVQAGRDVQGQRGCYWDLVGLHLASGQPDVALAVLDEASASLGLGPDSPGMLWTFGALRADALSQVGRTDEARTVIDEALKLVEGAGAWRLAWNGRRARGKVLSLLGQFEEADRDFSFAAESFRAARRPLLLGRTLRDWGAALIREGSAPSRQRAQVLKEEALTIFDQLGDRLDAELAQKVMAQ